MSELLPIQRWLEIRFTPKQLIVREGEGSSVAEDEAYQSHNQVGNLVKGA